MSGVVIRGAIKTVRNSSTAIRCLVNYSRGKTRPRNTTNRPVYINRVHDR